MSFCISIVKFILFVFNLICALCGLALIAVGVGFMFKHDDVLNAFNDNNVHVMPIVFVVIGSAIFLIAFFGCCGAICESECMVLTYAVLLFVLLVAQIIFVVLVLVKKDEILKNYWIERQNHTFFWDTIQQRLKCCGYNSSTEWDVKTPRSCCQKNAIECIALVNAYSDGCVQSIQKLFKPALLTCGTVAGIELVGIIFACYLGNHIRNYRRSIYGR